MINLSPMVVPVENSAEVNSFCERFFPGKQAQFIQYRPNEQYREKDCYENVKSHFKKLGGEIIWGWSLWIWPNVFIEAFHHAVWKSPTGILIDITPDSTSTFDSHLFVIDQESTFDDNMERYENKRMPLNEDPLVIEYFRINEQLNFMMSQQSPGYFEEFNPSSDLIAMQVRKEYIEMQLLMKYGNQNGIFSLS